MIGSPPPGNESTDTETRPRTVQFSLDDRARVPFALVGVLLLLTSSAYAGALSASGQFTHETAVERAMERVDAETTPAVRNGVTTAAHATALEPVTTPANSAAGDALRDGTVFEDALRIRIYLAVQQSLLATNTTEGDVVAVASIPPVDAPKDLERARDAISIEAVDDGGAMRVTVANVTTVATRGGHQVSSRTMDVTVTVAIPVLAAHERTRSFESRLETGPLEGPGLGRELTASLYPMTWARGYAQYSGAPVSTVLGNRHVELATNAGIVRTQADVFGTTDPSAEAGVHRSAHQTGLTDVLEPTALPEEEWTRMILGDPLPDDDAGSDSTVDARQETSNPGPIDDNATMDSIGKSPFETSGSDRTTGEFTVGVNQSADVGFHQLNTELDARLEESYRVDVRYETAATRLSRESAPAATPPGANWTLDSERTRTRYRVAPDGSTGAGPANSDWTSSDDRISARDRVEVLADNEVIRTWERNGSHTQTTVSYEVVYRVDIDITGTYSPGSTAPDRSTVPLYTEGGALTGPNLGDIPPRIRPELGVASPDRIAERTVRNGGQTGHASLHGDRPAELEDWVIHDLAALREEVRNRTVTVDADEIAAGTANPPAELADAIRADRASLLDAPDEYHGSAERARYELRAGYLDAVISDLERRATESRTATDATTDALIDADVPFADERGALLEIDPATVDDDPDPVGSQVVDGGVVLEPVGTPGYLPRTAVTHGQMRPNSEVALPAERPVSTLDAGGNARHLLTTRNVNVFTVPYGQVAGGIVDRVLGGPTVDLRTGTRTLEAVTTASTELEEPPAELESNRIALAEDVEEAFDRIEEPVDAAVRQETSLSRAEREQVIRSANRRFPTATERASALESGAYTDAVTAEATEVGSLDTRDRERLRSTLRIVVLRSLAEDDARVQRETVQDAATVTREVAREEFENAVEAELRRGGEEVADRWMPSAMRGVGAGLPVAPVPGSWYATVNVWVVEVRGVFPRFSLHAEDASARGPATTFEYVREDREATVTVGGDEVRLGHVEPISFETETTVVIAVPPGPPGVGDTDGVMIEDSPGWPCPDRDTTAAKGERNGTAQESCGSAGG